MGALAIGDLESHEQSAGTFRAVDRGSGVCSVGQAADESVAGPKRLITTIVGRGIQRDLGAAESGTA